MAALSSGEAIYIKKSLTTCHTTINIREPVEPVSFVRAPSRALKQLLQSSHQQNIGGGSSLVWHTSLIKFMAFSQICSNFSVIFEPLRQSRVLVGCLNIARTVSRTKLISCLIRKTIKLIH